MRAFEKLEPVGLILIMPLRFTDRRGFFSETYNGEVFDAGVTCWAGFAMTTFVEEGLGAGRIPEVKHILTSDYPTPAERPLRTILDCSSSKQIPR